MRDLGARNGFDVTATEDAATFTAGGLAPYDAVVFLLTTGDVLDNAQQAAFEAYIRAGHGYVGVHSASDTEREWPWYGRLVGAWSSGHPEIQPAAVESVTPRDGLDGGAAGALEPHGRVVRLPHEPARERRPRPAHPRRVDVPPARVSMGADHPIAWQHEFDGGRAWYTAGGHTTESYSEPLFLGHLLGGIQWALANARAEEAKPAAKVAPAIRSLAVTARNAARRREPAPCGLRDAAARRLVVRSKTRG